MFDTHDRYALALGVLNGDPETNMILADMLDEEGDRALAEWSRTPKKKKNKRLDFVLAVLPYKTGVLLACDFLIRGLYYHADTDRLLDGVRQVRSWATGEATGTELEKGCLVVSGVPAWQYGIKDIDQTMQALHTAAKCAEIAELCEQRGEASQFRKHASEARNAVRRIARAAREIVKPIASQKLWQQRNRNDWVNQLRDKWRGPEHIEDIPDELGWQVSHVEAVVTEMLENDSCRG